MSFNILLIRPPALTGNTFSRVSGIMPPLNLMYIASYIKKKYNTQDNELNISILDLELNPLRVRELKETFEAFQPDIVGITAHTNNMPAVAFFCPGVKASPPVCRVVIGGPQ
ncbi:MAG: cobalamin-dependent protein, partial [Candidatus Sigynarchaeota archaeon]